MRHGAQFVIGAQQPAETYAQDLGVAVLAHGQSRFQVLVGVKSAGAQKVPAAQGSGGTEQTEDVFRCRDQFHRSPPGLARWGESAIRPGKAGVSEVTNWQEHSRPIHES